MELFFTGKTIEEAMAAAHAQLGEDATPEIVDLPARRLFKTIPARVRVVVNEPDPVEAPPKVASAASTFGTKKSKKERRPCGRRSPSSIGRKEGVRR